MASGALQAISQVQTAALNDQYEKKLSNKFVEELKATTLFQANWGELLSAAPTALSLMGSCWLAAANPTAEKISLADAKPANGFQYMMNVPNPTLRSCLVDVCNNGGRHAFTLAGANMDALQITSRRICEERIFVVFKRLGPSTRGQDEYDDFQDALKDFSDDAQTCSRLAAEIREAFGKWGKMVGELHATTENQADHTAISSDKTKIDEAVATIEQTYATEATERVKKEVARAATNVEKQQKNLDKMIDNVPGPWASVLQGAVTSFAQAVPSLLGGMLPMALASSNPASAAALAASAVASKAGAAANDTTPAAAKSQAKAPVDDPAYAAAAAIQDLVNHFWEYMGNDTGAIVWDKFKETKAADSKDDADTPQGLAYFLGTLKGQKSTIEVTKTEPNTKLLGVYDGLITVATELQAHLQKQNQINATAKPEDTVVAEWKKKVKKARDDVLELSAAAKITGSGSVPLAFGKIPVPTPDLSAQTAQLNTAMQGVQIAQAAVDNAENAYAAAIDKQENTAKAMSKIQAKLESLQKKGKTLEEIKQVLRDCIFVLADLVVEIGKLENFFIMLQTVIEHVVMPRARDFGKELGKAGERALKYGALRIDDVSKQTIYTATLQLKSYFSLLQDISAMYSVVHLKHISKGVDLVSKLSKGTSSNNAMPELQEELTKYTENAAKTVADMVAKEQQKIIRTLRERAQRALDDTRTIQAEVARFGVKADTSANAAIKAGAQEQKMAAKFLLQNDVRMTTSVVVVGDSENVDATEL